MMISNKFEIIGMENDIFKIMKDGTGYVGIVYHPETGRELEKFYSGSENGVRMQLVKYIYSTIPMGYEKY